MSGWDLAARLNIVLSLMAHAKRLRFVSAPFATILGQLVIGIQEPRVATFAPGSPDEYDMLQLWVQNELSTDAPAVRVETRWTAESSLLDVQTQPGLWMHVKNSDMANFSLGASEDVNLLSNGAPQHVGVAVKYRNDSDAYIVTPVGFHRLLHEIGTWRLESRRISLGAYTVDLTFRANGGKRTRIQLKVTNPGVGSSLQCEILSGHLVAP